MAPAQTPEVTAEAVIVVVATAAAVVMEDIESAFSRHRAKKRRSRLRTK
jgi:hypothetical protein